MENCWWQYNKVEVSYNDVTTNIYFFLFFRAIALNQHRKEAEILLQKLIRSNIVDLHIVLQTYTSGVINMSVESIECLEMVMGNLYIGQTGGGIRKGLLQYILSSDSFKTYEYFLNKKTAEFIVNLCLKKWPEIEINTTKRKLGSEITDIHLKSLMENLLVLPDQNNHISKINNHQCHHLEFGMFTKLNETLEILIRDISDSVEITIRVLVFLTNILSFLTDYNLFDIKDISNSTIVILINQLFQKTDLKTLTSYRQEREMKKLMECINNLFILFSDMKINKEVMKIIKDMVPVDLLKSLFELQGIIIRIIFKSFKTILISS